MKEIWVLSVKTSLPKVRYDEELLKTTFSAFDSFEKARDTVRKILRDFAFSENSMFDGKGNIINLQKHFGDMLEWDDEFDDEEWLSALEVFDTFRNIFSGIDYTPTSAHRIYDDDMIRVDFTSNEIYLCGTGDGPINGCTPLIVTNMFSMQKEQDYYLYINDMFTYIEASSELYIDLKKVEVL